jgi:hypothetical protein
MFSSFRRIEKEMLREKQRHRAPTHRLPWIRARVCSLLHHPFLFFDFFLPFLYQGYVWVIKKEFFRLRRLYEGSMSQSHSPFGFGIFLYFYSITASKSSLQLPNSYFSFYKSLVQNRCNCRCMQGNTISRSTIVEMQENSNVWLTRILMLRGTLLQWHSVLPCSSVHILPHY